MSCPVCSKVPQIELVLVHSCKTSIAVFALMQTLLLNGLMVKSDVYLKAWPLLVTLLQFPTDTCDCTRGSLLVVNVFSLSWHFIQSASQSSMVSCLLSPWCVTHFPFGYCPFFNNPQAIMSQMIFPLPWFAFRKHPNMGELIVVVTALRCSNRTSWISCNGTSGKFSITSGLVFIVWKNHCWFFLVYIADLYLHSRLFQF